jgi:hypothetical protein
MFCMVTALVFDFKFINNKEEGDRARAVGPAAGGMFRWCVSVRLTGGA